MVKIRNRVALLFRVCSYITCVEVEGTNKVTKERIYAVIHQYIHLCVYIHDIHTQGTIYNKYVHISINYQDIVGNPQLEIEREWKQDLI